MAGAAECYEELRKLGTGQPASVEVLAQLSRALATQKPEAVPALVAGLPAVSGLPVDAVDKLESDAVGVQKLLFHPPTTFLNHEPQKCLMRSTRSMAASVHSFQKSTSYCGTRPRNF